MIRFKCPRCGGVFTVADEIGGRAANCTNCQTQFIVPPAISFSHSNPSTISLSLPRPSPNSNSTVEIEPCPKCHTRLSVYTQDVGGNVECPGCRTVLAATAVHSKSHHANSTQQQVVPKSASTYSDKSKKEFIKQHKNERTPIDNFITLVRVPFGIFASVFSTALFLIMTPFEFIIFFIWMPFAAVFTSRSEFRSHFWAKRFPYLLREIGRRNGLIWKWVSND